MHLVSQVNSLGSRAQMIRSSLEYRIRFRAGCIDNSPLDLESSKP
jgi:hypothetical protein